MQFCLFARFFTSFRFRLHCLNLSKNIAFLAAFLAVSRVLLSFVCVCMYRHKRPLFWPFLAVKFSIHPQPLIDPHRDRGCLSELFFLKFFLPAPPPANFIFFIFYFQHLTLLCLLLLYLTTNSHFLLFLFYVSENEDMFYLTAI